jgi:hypothetical protein
MMHRSSCQYYLGVTFALEGLQVLVDVQIQHDVNPKSLQLACVLQVVEDP